MNNNRLEMISKLNLLLKKGIDYHRAEDYSQAKLIYEDILKINPKNFDALHLLGVLEYQCEKYNLSISLIKKAIKINPKVAFAYSNLGNSLKSINELNEAIENYDFAIKIETKYYEAITNKGATLAQMQRKDEAEKCYLEAIQINPLFEPAYMNLAELYKTQVRLKKARECYEKVIKINSKNFDAYFNLAFMHIAEYDIQNAELNFNKSTLISLNSMSSASFVYLAVLDYLSFKIEGCKINLNKAKSIYKNENKKFKEAKAFYIYLNNLISWHDAGNSNLQLNLKNERLYVIGDSHTLTAHGLSVKIFNKVLQCEGNWIPGCKQWHLGQINFNIFKSKFESISKSIPEHSYILLTIGEIDCRNDEGIVKALLKYKDKTIGDLTLETASAFINYVKKIASNKDHKIIISAIPAPFIIDYSINSTYTKQSEIIKYLNLNLKILCLKNDLIFLDIYSLTNFQNDVANGYWHIDNYHLKPSAIQEAFNKHLILPNSRQPT